ncbi:MAG TPA: M4 family peptidase, partial [Candidatus Paceibacterota bacterium]|nr:M4 family peptidase [Candidatus Paceibacterota bacterium]
TSTTLRPSSSATIYLSPSGGFSNSVSYTLSGAPSGAGYVFNPSSVSGPTYGQSRLTLYVPDNTPISTYSMTVTGRSSDGQTHTTNVILDVAAANGGQQ